MPAIFLILVCFLGLLTPWTALVAFPVRHSSPVFEKFTLGVCATTVSQLPSSAIKQVEPSTTTRNLQDWNASFHRRAIQWAEKQRPNQSQRQIEEYLGSLIKEGQPLHTPWGRFLKNHSEEWALYQAMESSTTARFILENERAVLEEKIERRAPPEKIRAARLLSDFQMRAYVSHPSHDMMKTRKLWVALVREMGERVASIVHIRGLISEFQLESETNLNLFQSVAASNNREQVLEAAVQWVVDAMTNTRPSP